MNFWEILDTPPEWEDNINKLLRNLENFINNKDDIDPLIKMPVIHYQFESIHPFYDWNGRTWRILNVLYLVLTKKLDFPILFLSEYINKTKNKYYKLLNQTSKTWDYTDFIIYLLEGIISQAKDTSNKIVKIKNLIIKTENEISSLNMDYAKITKILFSYPFLTVTDFAIKMWLSRQSITNYINILEKNNVISSIRVWRNKLIYIKEFIELLK